MQPAHCLCGLVVAWWVSSFDQSAEAQYAQPHYGQGQPQYGQQSQEPQYGQPQYQVQPQYGQQQPPYEPQSEVVEQPPADGGFGDRPISDWPFAPHVVFRLGHFLPVGGLEDEQSLSDNSGGLTMFYLATGARIENFAFDLSFGIGGASLEGPIRDHVAMSGFDPGGILSLYFGVESYYQFVRGSEHMFYPFVGLGLGYQGLMASGTMGDWSLSRSYGTFQFRPMVGVDWAIVPAFAIGISLEMGLGVYGDVTETASRADDPITFEIETDSISMDFRSSGGLHAWIGGSVRLVIFP
jgi:hypothetical protein